MMVKTMNNMVNVIGEIKGEFRYSHTEGKQKFYKARITIERPSGLRDYIWIVVKNKDLGDLLSGMKVSVSGKLRNRIVRKRGDTRSFVYVNAETIEVYDPRMELIGVKNFVWLEGTIYKQPIKIGRKTEFCVKVKRPSGMTDLIYCEALDEDAEVIKDLQNGTEIIIGGRIQSRQYTKNGRLREVYEVIVNPYSYFIP